MRFAELFEKHFDELAMLESTSKRLCLAYPWAFNNSGQICFAGTRIFVQRAIQEEFVERLVARCRLWRDQTQWLRLERRPVRGASGHQGLVGRSGRTRCEGPRRVGDPLCRTVPGQAGRVAAALDGVGDFTAAYTHLSSLLALHPAADLPAPWPALVAEALELTHFPDEGRRTKDDERRKTKDERSP